MHKSIEKVAQEYVLYVEGLGFRVKGRVCERLDSDPNQRYSWDISHHYRPSESAFGVYYPSGVLARTFDAAEGLLLGYMKNFTALDVTPNAHY